MLSRMTHQRLAMTLSRYNGTLARIVIAAGVLLAFVAAHPAPARTADNQNGTFTNPVLVRRLPRPGHHPGRQGLLPRDDHLRQRAGPGDPALPGPDPLGHRRLRPAHAGLRPPVQPDRRQRVRPGRLGPLPALPRRHVLHRGQHPGRGDGRAARPQPRRAVDDEPPQCRPVRPRPDVRRRRHAARL